jgi:hypothetical protein
MYNILYDNAMSVKGSVGDPGGRRGTVRNADLAEGVVHFNSRRGAAALLKNE